MIDVIPRLRAVQQCRHGIVGILAGPHLETDLVLIAIQKLAEGGKIPRNRLIGSRCRWERITDTEDIGGTGAVGQCDIARLAVDGLDIPVRIQGDGRRFSVGIRDRIGEIGGDRPALENGGRSGVRHAVRDLHAFVTEAVRDGLDDGGKGVVQGILIIGRVIAIGAAGSRFAERLHIRHIAKCSHGIQLGSTARDGLGNLQRIVVVVAVVVGIAGAVIRMAAAGMALIVGTALPELAIALRVAERRVAIGNEDHVFLRSIARLDTVCGSQRIFPVRTAICPYASHGVLETAEAGRIRNVRCGVIRKRHQAQTNLIGVGSRVVRQQRICQAVDGRLCNLQPRTIAAAGAPRHRARTIQHHDDVGFAGRGGQCGIARNAQAEGRGAVAVIL